jgi:hypothetical protein
MSDERRVFDYRLHSAHGEADNEILDLACERLGEDGWEPYSVCMTSPPFSLFVYSAFVCQLAYLRMNATERGLGLERVRGHLRVTTDSWLVQDLQAEFWIHLRAGTATEGDLAFIVERMEGCPVSRNLPAAAKRTLLHLE